MATYDIETAYKILMSPTPYMQSSGAAMVRNFQAAAELMASGLREGGSTASGAGDAGAATQEQAERHAAWFDKVAQNSSDAAEQLDKIAQAGHGYQATAATVHAGYQDAVKQMSSSAGSAAAEVHVIKVGASGGETLSSQVEDWGSDYASFKMPTAPPAPAAAGSGSVHVGSSSGAGSYSGGGSGVSAGSSYSASGAGAAGLAAIGAYPVAGFGTDRSVLDRGAGVPGSVEVGPDGGEFAGWYKDPHTGYYVDPSTGREFDPITSRWVDPVTGQPFGQVTQYATGLQGVGNAAGTGGIPPGRTDDANVVANTPVGFAAAPDGKSITIVGENEAVRIDENGSSSVVTRWHPSSFVGLLDLVSWPSDPSPGTSGA